MSDGPGDPTPPQQPQQPFDSARVEAEVAALKAQHAPQSHIDAYLLHTYGLKPAVSGTAADTLTVSEGPPAAAAHPNIHEQYKSGALAKRSAELEKQYSAEAAQSGGDPVVNALINIIPKGSPLEALQAGARVAASRVPVLNRLMGGPEDYGQALADIHAAKDSTNPLVRAGLGTIGTVAQIGALPGSLPVQMGLYGAAKGLLNPDYKDVQQDPVGAVKHRAISGGVQGVANYLGGRVLSSFLPTLPGIGATAEAAAAAKDAQVNAAEATANRLAGAAQRTAFGREATATADEAAQAAARTLAQQQTERTMLTRGAQIADRVLANRSAPSTAMSDPSQSATAFLNSIPQMTREEAQAALDGFQGRTTEFFRKNLPIGGLRKLGGIIPGVKNTVTANRLAPFIDALRARAGAASLDLPAGASINSFLQSLGSTDQQQ